MGRVKKSDHDRKDTGNFVWFWLHYLLYPPFASLLDTGFETWIAFGFYVLPSCDVI